MRGEGWEDGSKVLLPIFFCWGWEKVGRTVFWVKFRRFFWVERQGDGLWRGMT